MPDLHEDEVAAEMRREAELAMEIHRDSAPSAGALALARLDRHEAICALRYVGLMERVVRLEKVIITAAGALLVTLFGVIVTLLLHVPR